MAPKADLHSCDYYIVLGIDSNAQDAQIAKAYRQLALKCHPDKNPDRREQAEAEFKKLLEAYEVLRSPAKRRVYDQGRHRGNSQSAASRSNPQSGTPRGYPRSSTPRGTSQPSTPRGNPPSNTSRGPAPSTPRSNAQRCNPESDNWAIPPGWEVHWSQLKERVYFFNRETKECTWTKPGNSTPQSNSQAGTPRGDPQSTPGDNSQPGTPPQPSTPRDNPQAGTPRGWSCNACTVSNGATARVCVCCGAPRPGNARSDPSPSPPQGKPSSDKEHKWQWFACKKRPDVDPYSRKQHSSFKRLGSYYYRVSRKTDEVIWETAIEWPYVQSAYIPSCGDRVVVEGLTGTRASELNGRVGLVVSPQLTQSSRIEVRLDSGEKVALKEQNLCPEVPGKPGFARGHEWWGCTTWTFNRGGKVTIHGYSRYAPLWRLNGKVAKVVAPDPLYSDFIEVRLWKKTDNDFLGEVFSINKANLGPASARHGGFIIDRLQCRTELEGQLVYWEDVIDGDFDADGANQGRWIVRLLTGHQITLHPDCVFPQQRVIPL